MIDIFGTERKQLRSQIETLENNLRIAHSDNLDTERDKRALSHKVSRIEGVHKSEKMNFHIDNYKGVDGLYDYEFPDVTLLRAKEEINDIRSLINCERISEKEFIEVQVALLDYFLLAANTKKSIPMMNKEVDILWHHFLMYPSKYIQFCSVYFDRLIDHKPSLKETDIFPKDVTTHVLTFENYLIRNKTLNLSRNSRLGCEYNRQNRDDSTTNLLLLWVVLGESSDDQNSFQNNVAVEVANTQKRVEEKIEADRIEQANQAQVDLNEKNNSGSSSYGTVESAQTSYSSSDSSSDSGSSHTSYSSGSSCSSCSSCSS